VFARYFDFLELDRKIKSKKPEIEKMRKVQNLTRTPLTSEPQEKARPLTANNRNLGILLC